MGRINGIFYARFMDDWVTLIKSKSALRKIVKITHQVVNALKFQLHPCKTYIGKISHGFNFLAYYMDDYKILPSKETIRRFHERAAALYEPSQANKNISRRYKKTVTNRDISQYQTNEAAPTDAYFKNILMRSSSLAALTPDTHCDLRRYLDQWTRWIKQGLSTINGFEACVQTHLPGIAAYWTPGAKALNLGAHR